MEPGNDKTAPQDIVYALNEESKSIVCLDKNTMTFFEYNDFAGKETVSLEVVFDTAIKNRRVRRMYFHYPYDYLSQKQKNQLKASVRGIASGSDLNTFVRDRYKEVLLCVEGSGLIKMSRMEQVPLEMADRIWKLKKIGELRTYIPVDVAININTGEIYCLCEQSIQVIPNSGSELTIMNEQMYKRKKEFYYNEKFT